jgi:hypothetical protein
VPYIHIKKKFPRLKKKPRKSRFRAHHDEDDDDEKEEEEEHEEEHDVERDDDDDDEEGRDDEGKSKKSGDDEGDEEDGETAKTVTTGDANKKVDLDEENEDSVSNVSSKKSKKSGGKKEKKKKTKKRAATKKKKKRGSDDEEDDDDYTAGKNQGASAAGNKLTPLQERETAVKIYIKGLNQNKKFFRDLEANIPPIIIEAPYEDIDAADDGYALENREEQSATGGRRVSLMMGSQSKDNAGATQKGKGSRKSSIV